MKKFPRISIIIIFTILRILFELLILFLFLENGLVLINKALLEHSKDDELLYSSAQLLVKLIGKETYKSIEIPFKIQNSGCIEALLIALEGYEEISKHTVKVYFKKIIFTYTFIVYF